MAAALFAAAGCASCATPASWPFPPAPPRRRHDMLALARANSYAAPGEPESADGMGPPADAHGLHSLDAPPFAPLPPLRGGPAAHGHGEAHQLPAPACCRSQAAAERRCTEHFMGQMHCLSALPIPRRRLLVRLCLQPAPPWPAPGALAARPATGGARPWHEPGGAQRQQRRHAGRPCQHFPRGGPDAGRHVLMRSSSQQRPELGRLAAGWAAAGAASGVRHAGTGRCPPCSRPAAAPQHIAAFHIAVGQRTVYCLSRYAISSRVRRSFHGPPRSGAQCMPPCFAIAPLWFYPSSTLPCQPTTYSCK